MESRGLFGSDGDRCDICSGASWESDSTRQAATITETIIVESVAHELQRLGMGPGTRSLHLPGNGDVVSRFAQELLGWTGERDHPHDVERLEDHDRFDVVVAVVHGPEGADLPTLLSHAAGLLRPAGVLVVVAIPAVPSQVAAEALRRSGLMILRAVRDGETEVSIASRTPLDDDSRGSSAITPAFADFCARLATDSELPLDARLVMAVRHYAAIVNLGKDARSVERALFSWIRSERGIDLAHPDSLDPAHLATLPSSGLMAAVAFAAGMTRVVHRHDWARAGEYFTLAERLIEIRRGTGRPLSRAEGSIATLAFPHRLLSLVHTDTARAMTEWRRRYAAGTLNDRALWTVRLFVEAAGSGHRGIFDSELEVVSQSIADLGSAGGAWHSMAAVDGAAVLAQFAASLGDRWCATQWVSVAKQTLEARRDVLDPLWHDGAARMLAGVREFIDQSRTRALPSTVPMPGPDHEAMLWQTVRADVVPGAVSVIIAYYRGERYLTGALESIEHQTVPPLEVIIVDDGSPGAMSDEVQQRAYPFDLRVVRQSNAGQSAARNTGIRAARGEYVAFLDQDDEWKPHHLATLIPVAAGNSRLAWVYSDFVVVDGDGQRMVDSYLRDKEIATERATIADLVATDIMALPSASIMRRDALLEVRGFDRRLSGYEDDELFIRLRMAGWMQSAVPEATVRYRVHGANSSASVSFQRSRLIFLTLMTSRLVGNDDGWSELALLGERLLKATLSDYLRLLSTRKDQQAQVAARVVRRIGETTGTHVAYSTLGLYLLERPPIMRVILAVAGRLPRRFRQALISEGILRNYRRAQREAQARRVRNESL